MKRKYTDLQLADAVNSSSSVRQVLSKLGLVEAGGNYASIQNQIQKIGLNTAHFHGKSWNKGLKFNPKIPMPLTEILKQQSHYQSHKLRKRLIREGIFESKCYQCQNTIWMGQPIPLELEHIDGNRLNNELNNLTLLCPNCHALTPSFRRRKS